MLCLLRTIALKQLRWCEDNHGKKITMIQQRSTEQRDDVWQTSKYDNSQSVLSVLRQSVELLLNVKSSRPTQNVLRNMSAVC